jgi:opacity protein-like surface antigen
MKKLVLSAVAALALSSAAHAAGGDMAELTCKELIGVDAESAGVILFWIDGYLSHKTGNTQVDFDEIKKNGEKIGQYCAANPDAKVLEYVEGATAH